MSKVVIFGASSGVGRALASRLASEKRDLVILARSGRDIENIASDLKLKYNTFVYPKVFDIEEVELDVGRLFSECKSLLKEVDAVIISVGSIDPEDSPVVAWETIKKISTANYLGIIRALQPFIDYFKERGKGQIIAFSSVAAIAPRSRNTVYSSAKMALETYLKGLRHYLQESGIIVKVYALGYVDTSMSYGQKLLFPTCSVEKVADHVISNIDKDFCKIYYPRYWALIAWTLQRLPWTIYKRLKF